MLLTLNGATTHKALLEDDIKTAAAAGYRGLEIDVGKLDQYLLDWWHVPAAEQLRDLFAQQNVQPVSVCTVEGITFTGDQFDLVKRRCRLLAETMKVLGCPYLVVAPGISPRGVRADDVRKETVKVLRSLADEVAPYQVSLAFEPQGFHWSSVRTIGAAWDIVKEVNRAEVGLAIDMVHFALSESPLTDLDRLSGDKIFLVQVADMEPLQTEMAGDVYRVMPGKGAIPLANICSHIKAIGYDGAFSLELYHPALWEQEAVAISREGRSSMARLLKPYYQVD
jgi:2-keto-myo-inositol isomerase